jgi:hypothetical protein
VVLRVAQWLSTSAQSIALGIDFARFLQRSTDPVCGMLLDDNAELIEVISTLTEFKVTVPHDRIYAWHGQLPGSYLRRTDLFRLEPNYNKTYEEVARDAHAVALENGKNLNELRTPFHQNLDPVVHGQLASWVPWDDYKLKRRRLRSSFHKRIMTDTMGPAKVRSVALISALRARKSSAFMAYISTLLGP